MYTRFGLSSIVLIVDIEGTSLSVIGSPKDCCSVPTYVHSEATSPMFWDLESGRDDVAFRDLIYSSRAKLRNSLRTRVPLPGWDAGEDCFLKLLGEVGDIFPFDKDTGFTHLV